MTGSADVDGFEEKLKWVAAHRRANAEGVHKARALALPLPPSFHDGVRVARAERAVVAQFDCSQLADANAVAIGLLPQLEEAGVTAICVHGDNDRFDDLYQSILLIAQFTSLPILCAELVLDPLQVAMARAHGAAAVLLDPTVHQERELRALCRAATDLGMDPVLIVRQPADLEVVARLTRGGAENSPLRIFGAGCPQAVCGEADLPHFEKLSLHLPENAVSFVMAEVTSSESAAHLVDLGYEAMLVRVDLVAEDALQRVLRIAGAPAFA